MNRSKAEHIITYLVGRQEGHELTKVRLQKLLYLIDLEYYRYTGQTLTGSTYIYGKFGPWDPDLDEKISALNGHELAEVCRPRICGDGYYFLYSPGPDSRFKPELSPAEATLIDRIWEAHIHLPQNVLLEECVYTTEPMADAQRWQPLDFSKARRVTADLEAIDAEMSVFRCCAPLW